MPKVVREIYGHTSLNSACELGGPDRRPPRRPREVTQNAHDRPQAPNRSSPGTAYPDYVRPRPINNLAKRVKRVAYGMTNFADCVLASRPGKRNGVDGERTWLRVLERHLDVVLDCLNTDAPDSA